MSYNCHLVSLNSYCIRRKPCQYTYNSTCNVQNKVVTSCSFFKEERAKICDQSVARNIYGVMFILQSQPCDSIHCIIVNLILFENAVSDHALKKRLE